MEENRIEFKTCFALQSPQFVQIRRGGFGGLGGGGGATVWNLRVVCECRSKDPDCECTGNCMRPSLMGFLCIWARVLCWPMHTRTLVGYNGN